MHLWCLALNYVEHHSEVESAGRVQDLPKKPALFLRAADSMTGNGQPLIAPHVSEQFDYEGELAVIIGKEGRNIAEEDAMEHVAGYAVFNDGSIRDWQFHTRQITPGKNFYQTASLSHMASSANLNQAYKRVKANKGAPGTDGMTVDDLRGWIADNREGLIVSLLDGSYRPQPVRGVEIPKPGGKGMRQICIPTVVDRLVQQAILQVLEPLLDPTFSASSYGFRPGRSAHDALRQAREYVSEGYGIVADLDLEKFFDRVNHDIALSRPARHIGDERLLGIIRRFLKAGMFSNGVVVERQEGAVQGGPLSPLIANLILDDLDKELERRGHRFCRYADDCNIYVRSQVAGECVMASVSAFLEGKLRLRVNQDKSAVAPVRKRKFLGHRLLSGGRLGVAPESLARMKERLRQLTRRNRGISLASMVAQVNAFTTGWVTYYRHAQQGGGTDIIADLPCGHEETDRTAVRIGNGMKLGVHAAFARHRVTELNEKSDYWFEAQGLLIEQCAHLGCDTPRFRS